MNMHHFISRKLPELWMDRKVKFWVILALIFAFEFAMSRMNVNTPAAPPAPVENPQEVWHRNFIRTGSVAAMAGIRAAAKNPDGVEFKDLIGEWDYPGTNVCTVKWRITGTNDYGATMQAIAVGSAHFKGGDVTNLDNWEITSANIETQ